MATIYPVIMCGGAGTRLWPLSRKALPKQYHALVGERTLLEDTISRISRAQGLKVAPPSFVSAAAHQDIIRTQCENLGISPLFLILEPFGRNTAPVAAIVSMVINAHDPDGIVLLLPADHYIKDTETFWQRVKDGMALAATSKLVTLGIKPTSPHTGYGYIERGGERGKNTFDVKRFVEKPNLPTAKQYIDSESFYWNAGIFLFSPQTMLNAFGTHAPQFIAPCSKTLKASPAMDGIIALDPDTFAACPNDSIDFAIMENADNVALVAPVDIGWNDIGSWPALYDLHSEGEERSHNLEVGDVMTIDCEGSLVRSDGPLIAGIGLKDMIVVATDDAVLVLPKDRAQDIKSIIEDLKQKDRTDLL